MFCNDLKKMLEETKKPFDVDFLHLLKESQKFDIEETFIQAADLLIKEGKDLGKSLDFLILPFEHCWFEFSFSMMEKVEKWGFFLSQSLDDQQNILHINVTQLLKDKKINVMPFTFDVKVKSDDQYHCILEVWPKEAIAKARPKEKQEFFIIIKILAGIILLLNQPKFHILEEHSMAKLNKARLKKNKPRLYDYTKIIVKPEYKTIFKESFHASQGSTTSKAHLRRGHFKVLPSGKIAWWNPHIVNKGAKDMLVKDYTLKR